MGTSKDFLNRAFTSKAETCRNMGVPKFPTLKRERMFYWEVSISNLHLLKRNFHCILVDVKIKNSATISIHNIVYARSFIQSSIAASF